MGTKPRAERKIESRGLGGQDVIGNICLLAVCLVRGKTHNATRESLRR